MLAPVISVTRELGCRSTEAVSVILWRKVVSCDQRGVRCLLMFWESTTSSSIRLDTNGAVNIRFCCSWVTIQSNYTGFTLFYPTQRKLPQPKDHSGHVLVHTVFNAECSPVTITTFWSRFIQVRPLLLLHSLPDRDTVSNQVQPTWRRWLFSSGDEEM